MTWLEYCVDFNLRVGVFDSSVLATFCERGLTTAAVVSN